MIHIRGIDLCAQAFGNSTHPPLLLIMGTAASMLWWDARFCTMLADGGRFVIRYDHRDTGRSTTCEPGKPDYDADDLVKDAVAVLDAFGVESAHLVGVSAGGALAQVMALDFPTRTRSLTLISTSPAVGGGSSGTLPPPEPAVGQFLKTAPPNYADLTSVVEYRVAYARVLAGKHRDFPEAEVQRLVRHDVDRARNPASATNHDLLSQSERPDRKLSSLATPTLVIHGEADPLFPLAHGEALASEIPHARLVVLPRAGHGVEHADWSRIASLIHEHSST
ncbi:MAG: alpha/beta fold hydrolase [Nocardioides sp.]